MDLGYLAVQLFNGLVNGAFYALLSLGLAVIFGVMRVVNFAHGAVYMLGAFAAYLLLQQFGVGFWPALVLAPLGVAILGAIMERLLLRRVYGLDPLYGFLLTFGLTLFLQDAMRLRFGIQGQPYPLPEELSGSTTERGELTRALGINVDRWITGVFAFGIALAALAGVLAAPMRNVSPLMGSELIILTFAVVVIGGMGSILGAVAAGFLVGVLASLFAVFDPALENLVAFVLMALVLLVRPAGLFGSREAA